MNYKFTNIILFACLFAIVSTREIPSEADNLEDSLFKDVPASKIEAMASGLCLNEHNNERAKYSKGALTYDTKLQKAAQNHNNVMTSNNCFSHQCTKNGEAGLGTRVTNAGYRWSGVAENIAAGQADCKSVMQSWMDSSGHKANILGNYKSVGCAVNKCSKCDYNNYWTCVFASPA